jgi:predicted phosphodiesterase
MSDIINFKIIQKELDDYDANIWQEMEQKSKGYIEHFKEKSKCEIPIDEKKYVLICPLGDEHIGHDGVDYERLKKDALAIGNCKYALAFDASDTTDNFINSKILEAIINSRTTPKMQIKLFQQFVEFFQGHYILSVSGNHQNWSKKVSGIDWLNEFMNKNQVVYNRDEIKIYIELNGIKYCGKLRHKVKNKSMYNKTHGLKQNQRFYSEEIFDFIIAGHYHDAAIEQSRNFDRVQLFIQTGTYKITDPHAFECGFGMGYSDMPCFIISPFKKKLIPVYDIGTGIEIVESLNKELS